MKKGLIDPNAIVYYVSGWNPPAKDGEPYTPIITEVENSDRLAEVTTQQFEVASPLFWVDCPDDAVADQWYYNNSTKEVLPLPPSPPPPGGAINL